MNASKTVYLLALFAVLSSMVGCNDNELISGDEIELYLLETYSTVDNTEQIEESSIVLDTKPIVFYEDIISYDQNEFIFNLSDRAKSVIEKMNFPVNGRAFAVTVDRQLVYSGYFWPSYSSATCQWIYADPIMIDFYEGLKINLGYPGQLPGANIPDNRNDNRLLQVLRRDGKLID